MLLLLVLLQTADLQDALDARSGKGGVVEIPAGRRVLKRSLRVPSGVTLRGSGAVLVKAASPATVLAAPAKPGDRRIRVKDAAGFEVGMELALARLNDGYAPEDMDAWGFDWVHPAIVAIEGTTIELDRELDDAFAAGATWVLNFFPAIRVERAKDVVLEGLAIEADPAGQPKPFSEFQAAAIALLLAENVKIRACRVRGWPCDGISVQGGRAVEVVDCVVENVRGHGFHPGSSVTEARFAKNRAEGNLFDGLYFCQAVTKSAVEDNVFVRNGRHGIGGLGGGKDEKTRDADNLVARNVCEENGQAGIEVQVSTGHRILDNVCRGNSRGAPGAWPGLSIKDASGLTVTGNVTDGLRAVGGSSNVIENNR